MQCLNTVHYIREYPSVFVSGTPFDQNNYMKYPLKFEILYLNFTIL